MIASMLSSSNRHIESLRENFHTCIQISPWMSISTLEDPLQVVSFLYRARSLNTYRLSNSWDWISDGMVTKQIHNLLDGDDERWMQSILTIKCDRMSTWWDLKRDAGKFTICLLCEEGFFCHVFDSPLLVMRGCGLSFNELRHMLCKKRGIAKSVHRLTSRERLRCSVAWMKYLDMGINRDNELSIVSSEI